MILPDVRFNGFPRLGHKCTIIFIMRLITCRPPPLTMPACPDQCQTTQCNACYFSKNPLEAASKCDGRACTGLGFTRCLRNWASCVEKFNRQENMV